MEICFRQGKNGRNSENIKIHFIIKALVNASQRFGVIQADAEYSVRRRKIGEKLQRQSGAANRTLFFIVTDMALSGFLRFR